MTRSAGCKLDTCFQPKNVHLFFWAPVDHPVLTHGKWTRRLPAQSDPPSHRPPPLHLPPSPVVRSLYPSCVESARIWSESGTNWRGSATARGRPTGVTAETLLSHRLPEALLWGKTRNARFGEIPRSGVVRQPIATIVIIIVVVVCSSIISNAWE